MSFLTQALADEDIRPLAYFPQQISVNETVMDLTLNNLEKMTGIPFRFYSPLVKEQLGDTPLEPSWERMSMGIISEKSRGESYEQQKARVENTDREGGQQKYHMQQTLKVAVFMHLVHAFTGQWIYPVDTYNRCIEKVDGKHAVVVGWGVENERGSGSGGFLVDDDGSFDDDSVGVGAVRK